MIRRPADRWLQASTGVAAWGLAALAIGLIAVLCLIAWPHLPAALGEPGTGAFSGPRDPRRASLVPLLLGTAARTLLMSLMLIPAGLLTGIYLAEYAPPGAWWPRVLRGGIRALVGVPGVVFGMVGLGFLVGVVGGGIDRITGDPASPVWGRPGLVWASLTLAWMSLPVVVEASEDALRSVPNGLRSAALALGATRFQVLLRILLPKALPGMAGGILRAIGKASGEVAPLLFTGAAVAPGGALALNDRFPDVAFEVFALSITAPDADAGRPLLQVALWALVFWSLMVNAAATYLRRLPGTPHGERT